ncbi:MAG: flagellar biosynthesis anti-sigma factor FlgM [candidate division KSB1 bacterium]|nr:flagellar biosynthesis anti-sigma factor FlgM [candidate division KSB1 bacterium]
MRIEKPNMNQIEASQKAYKSVAAEKIAEQNRKAQNPSEVKRDIVEISSAAKELLARATQNGRLAQDSPDLIISKTQIAVSLQKAGLVDDTEKADKISEKVFQRLSEESGLKNDKIERVKERLESGFYDSPQVIEKIAEGLMKDMKFNQ